MRTSLLIAGRSARLEAILREPPTGQLRGAAVLCHPHPVHGGTMENRVIFRAGKAVLESGSAALRFNFRGVGASSGSYDHGEGEKDDVLSAIDFLADRYPGLPLLLVGFSFGAWVGLQVGRTDPRVQAMIGIGLPTGFYAFDFLVENRKPTMLVAGSRDEFCPRDKMEGLARHLPAESLLRWIEGADHFFARELDELETAIREFLGRLELKGPPR